jgi:hypothetical protein
LGQQAAKLMTAALEGGISPERTTDATFFWSPRRKPGARNPLEILDSAFAGMTNSVRFDVT